MHFDEAVRYLLDLGPETLTIKLGLKNTELLLQQLQNPERSFRAVQIAGTNGKGSTAAMLDSICRRAGIKTGLYTSPHLVSITERIKIAGVELSREKFAQHTATVREAATQLVNAGELQTLPTFFEQVTAIALVAFRHAQVELAILETGLGGRLDSTTAANADVCAITQIALDHEEYLGGTLASIAAEKAAIIRPGGQAVIAPQDMEALQVILDRCREVGVVPVVSDFKITEDEVTPDGRFRATFETRKASYDKVPLGLRGRHQIENAAIAIALAELLSIQHSAIVMGLETAVHPGRLELIPGNPTVLLDGAHNPAGAKSLNAFLKQFAARPLTLVFGAMREKRIDEIADQLFPLADKLILTGIDNPRSTSTESLLKLAERFSEKSITVTSSSAEALQIAFDQTDPDGMVCVTGSLYLIGEMREHLLKTKSDVEVLQTNTMTQPQIIDSKKVYSGKVFEVTVDTVREGEIVYQRDVVHHPGSAVIIPVFDDETVALVKQYRHPAVRYLLEAPAGTLSPGERPEAGAARELEEELGVVAGKLEKLTEFFVSPGFCEEKMWLYLATDLTETKQRLEPDEVIEVVRVSFTQALEMISDGEIEDAKTIIGLMLAASKLGSPLLEAMYPAV